MKVEKRWDITQVRYGSNTLDELLEQGWEPFAVVGMAGPDLVYLRRLIAPKRQPSPSSP